MLAEQVRQGQVETVHDGALAVSAPDGTVTHSVGDIDRSFFIRSSAKPFQGYVMTESGADLEPLELAMACASHRGFPAHIAIVEAILERGGLDPLVLQCPYDWPISESAARVLVASGERSPRRIWHNCSGKHAGFLRTCLSAGWSIEDYLDPQHPLQQRIIEFTSELGEYDVQPVGVDGCGAPVLRTTVRAMALMFARLATESRFERIRSAMHRYPSLVGANTEGDSKLAIATNSVVKGGAVGCVGLALDGQLGVAAKAWDGSNLIAYQAVATALDQLGLISEAGKRELAPVLEPPVHGGGQVVGSYESRLSLAG